MRTLHLTGIYKIVTMTLYFLLSGTLNVSSMPTDDFNVEDQLKKAVDDGRLNFPHLTQKLYNARDNQGLWFDATSSNEHLWSVASLIHSAPQYGLVQTDYHNGQLSADFMKELTQSSLASFNYKAMVDVLATDAMLSMITHLHYGRRNPSFPVSNIDKEKAGDIRPDSVLLTALKRPDFSDYILSVQPDFKGYKDLQYYLESRLKDIDRLSMSADTANLLALNLERWKWISAVDEPYVHINIPAFKLHYLDQKGAEEFKVIVGRPNTPTPVIRSSIGYFTTSPDWTVPRSIAVKELLPKAIRNPSYLENNNFRVYDKKGNTIEPSVENLKMVHRNFSSYTIKQSPGCDNALGKIVFNFENRHSVYLHDTPDRTLFNRSERALSHGCIRVNNPERLVALFLTQDDAAHKIPEVHKAMTSYKRTRTTFKRPIPIIISYFTCEVRDGVLVAYKDHYNQDPILEKNFKNN